MSLKLMYITNRPDIAQIAETAGVDRILVDMEYIGKADRQGELDTVQNHHTLEDIKKISNSIVLADLLVRVNPIHNKTDHYISSEEEIDRAIENGAKILMLPYFKTVAEAEMFIKIFAGRARVVLLLETPEAVQVVDDILKLDGLDDIFIGRNDLSLGYRKKFMFELLSDGIVEDLCYRFKKAGIPYGFGGIAALGKGDLPSEKIITEHYRLGSTCAILSRSFCNVSKIQHLGIISDTFINGVKEIRRFEEKVSIHRDFFTDNKKEIKEIIQKIG